jgi:hypothetical protein
VKKFLYSLNRVVLIIISAIMSFIFYYRAGGSNFFFQLLFGITAVGFDLKRIELWDNGKKFLASVFIAVSIIAFAGNSIAEISQYVSTESKAYDDTIASITESLKVATENQVKRIENTERNYGTAGQKETQSLMLMVEKQIEIAEQLKENESVRNDERVDVFAIASQYLGISLRQFLFFFFIIRAVLMEIGILASGEKKRKKEPIAESVIEQETTEEQREEFVEAEKPEVQKNMAMGILDRWKEESIKSSKPSLEYKVDMLKQELEELYNFSEKELFEKKVLDK